MQAVGISRGAFGQGRLLTVGSALAVGACGWLTAHALTYWLMAHGHTGPLGQAARHTHHYSASLAILAGCLAAAALLAVMITAGTGGRRGPRPPGHLERVMRRDTTLSTAAFVGAEIVQHWVMGENHRPPVAVLVLGAALHALIGAITSLVWLRCIDGMHHLPRLANTPRLDTRPRRPGPCAPGHLRRRREVWAFSIIGRAPPAGAFA